MSGYGERCQKSIVFLCERIFSTYFFDIIRAETGRGEDILDKKNLNGQSGGYCLSITREKLLTLWLAVLLLFLGAAASTYGWLQLQADKTGWSYMEYAKLVIGSGAITASAIWENAISGAWARFRIM